MDPALAAHRDRVRHLRERFAEANERLVSVLRDASDERAEQAPHGTWSAAQVAWHVAKVTTRFAGMISGDLSGPQPLSPEFIERPWTAIAAAIPQKLEANPMVQPPARVTRSEGIAELERSAVTMARALDVLTPQRGRGFGVTHPITGPICVYQIGEWAAAHVARHTAQAQAAIGS